MLKISVVHTGILNHRMYTAWHISKLAILYSLHNDNHDELMLKFSMHISLLTSGINRYSLVEFTVTVDPQPFVRYQGTYHLYNNLVWNKNTAA